MDESWTVDRAVAQAGAHRRDERLLFVGVKEVLHPPSIAKAFYNPVRPFLPLLRRDLSPNLSSQSNGFGAGHRVLKIVENVVQRNCAKIVRIDANVRVNKGTELGSH
jgi:hypothetical protein